MKVYIILAYPNSDGLCYAAFENVKKGFDDAGHEVKVTDLYKENFDPVLVFNKDKKRRDMQFDTETQVYRDNILWANHLVFIFPIWWSGMPAILKGFIDRVFATGFSYDFKSIIPTGYLKNKSAWIISTHDSPQIYVKLIQHDYGVVLKKQILSVCGIKKVKKISLSAVKRSSPEKRQKWLSHLYDLTKKLS